MSNWAVREEIRHPGSMTHPQNFATKKVPDSILVLGATGHLGGPFAQHIAHVAPEIRLRLATSNATNVARLQQQYPDAEVVVVDVLDINTMVPAFKDIEGVFVTTMSVLDTKRAMTNLAAACYHWDTMQHIVRFAGEVPAVRSEADLPHITRFAGDAITNLQARRVLEASDLPFTTVTGLAYFMDNLIRYFGAGLRNERKFATVANTLCGWADARDFAAAAANLMLSDDIRNVGWTYPFDNNHDHMLMSDVADVLTEGLGEKITFEFGPEVYSRVNAEDIERLRAESSAAIGAEIPYAEYRDYIVPYLGWEEMVCKSMGKSGWMEYFLGRKPITLAQWLEENREIVLGNAPTKLPTCFKEVLPFTVHDIEDGLSRRRAKAAL